MTINAESDDYDSKVMDDLSVFSKAFDAKVTADQTNPDNREFTALVSVFGNVDREGDVVMPGAFTDEIRHFTETGKSLPIVWNHEHSSLEAHIGVVAEMAELGKGDPRVPDGAEGAFWVRGVLDDDYTARKAHRLMKGGRITQFSFTSMGGMAKAGVRDGKQVREIHQIRDLVEVGPTLRGMNPATALLSVKSQPTERPSVEPSTSDVHGDIARRLKLLSLYV